MADIQEVTVYKSRRMSDTYLYVPRNADLSELPDALRERFGEGEAFLDIELHCDRHLAQADPVKVLEALQTQGFYLQLPPKNDFVDLEIGADQ